MMKNGTEALCPHHFHWLYAGIDFSLPGNGGPVCANYLSPMHRVVETIIVLSASVIEIAWSLKHIKYDDASKLAFRKSNSVVQNGEIKGYGKPASLERYGTITAYSYEYSLIYLTI